MSEKPVTYDDLIVESKRLIERLLDLPIGIGTHKNVRDVVKDINRLKRNVAEYRSAVRESEKRKEEWQKIEKKHRESMEGVKI